MQPRITRNGLPVQTPSDSVIKFPELEYRIVSLNLTTRVTFQSYASASCWCLRVGNVGLRICCVLFSLSGFHNHCNECQQVISAHRHELKAWVSSLCTPCLPSACMCNLMQQVSVACCDAASAQWLDMSVLLHCAVLLVHHHYADIDVLFGCVRVTLPFGVVFFSCMSALFWPPHWQQICWIVLRGLQQQHYKDIDVFCVCVCVPCHTYGAPLFFCTISPLCGAVVRRQCLRIELCSFGFSIIPLQGPD